MKATLIRHGSIPGMGTFGTLMVGGEILRTVEREWKGNMPGVSCVPAGRYTLEEHDSDSHPDVWALVNHDLGVYHYADPEAKRTAILIHIANRASELEGCIAPGLKFGTLGPDFAVHSSGAAVEKLRRILHDGMQLEIVWERHSDQGG